MSLETGVTTDSSALETKGGLTTEATEGAVVRATWQSNRKQNQG